MKEEGARAEKEAGKVERGKMGNKAGSHRRKWWRIYANSTVRKSSAVGPVKTFHPSV